MKKSYCFYCRCEEKHHLESCPHDSALAKIIWAEGRMDAINGYANMRANDPTYTLGYVQGEMEVTRMCSTQKLLEEQTDPPKHASNQPTPGQVALILSENETRKRMEDNY
ncbi:MAG: hypothetical protein WCK01_02115 [Candidatus Uhrbacteria bacterium]